jgi:hypothetical protein
VISALFFAPPTFQLFFARYRSANITELLEVNQLNTVILLSKTRDFSGAMLADPAFEIIGYPDIQRGSVLFLRM